MEKRKKQIEGEKEKKIEKKKQTEYQNKFLRNLLIGAFAVIVLVLFIAFMSSYKNNFEYNGVEFSVAKFCDSKPCLKTYSTKLPIIYENEQTFYNLFLRNDPRALAQKVPFEGELILRKNLSIDITFDRSCNGYEQIAIVNFVNLHNIADITTTGESGAICDSTGKSMYVLIQESEKTSIEQIGYACYVINVKDCEILEATERFMLETLIKINEHL